MASNSIKISSPLLPRELPAGLEPLADLAMDLRWISSHASDELWKSIDAHVWEHTQNPCLILQNVSQQRLQDLSKDFCFKEKLQRLALEREQYLTQKSWYSRKYDSNSLKRIAYFSMEFGLGQALPLYAGGLGILAGDYLKIASDLGVPLIAIGLLYQEGYFRQILDNNGWQHEVYPYNDPASLPITPVHTASGEWLFVTSNFPGRTVRFRVWQAQVGRVTLYLLDSNDPLNSPADRGISSKLYESGQEMRLVQEIALGICGWRLIEALGLNVDVCHLNEGHAAFATLERARSFMRQHNLNFWEALWATRPGNVFTTHTPVAAGFDSFPLELMIKYGVIYAEQVAVSPADLGALGQADPDNPVEPFHMAYLAVRTCGLTNGVSRLHSEVSRRIFQPLYRRWPQQEVPIEHITNGVHVSSWNSYWADEAWKNACGKEHWYSGFDNLEKANAIVSNLLRRVSDEVLWSYRSHERADLVDYARERLARQLGQRGRDKKTIAQAYKVLDPNVLTIGFARRFVEYKRPNLLLHDSERLVRLLTHSKRPVQIVVAGKAHPDNDVGKHFIQEWVNFVQQPEVRAHAVFLEDYDIALAKVLVQGIDVWINSPRRPWEACGTSGMKVLVNGGLNLSELDGWWAEAFTENVGWALGDGREHTEASWDADEAEQLYRLLEEEIVPEFYNRNTSGLPSAWITRIRASMARLTAQFSANRMMREYINQMYIPAATAFHQRKASGGTLASELLSWEQTLIKHWHEVHWGDLKVNKTVDGWMFKVQVYLGGVPADSVRVQLYADPTDSEDSTCRDMERQSRLSDTANSYIYVSHVITQRPTMDFTPRIVTFHPDALIPSESILIHWR